MVPEADLPGLQPALLDWAGRAQYRGNPTHKKNPGDFGLDPPSAPREGKTLCDDAEVFALDTARQLLAEGLRRGLVSVQRRNGWPQNVWAVAANGVEIEAMLENELDGSYHGYPLQPSDPFCARVQERWRAR